jgi:hypothetical protein
MLRLRRYAWRVLPLLLLLVLYWPGLTNWFYQDDFGWLNLRHDVHSFQDLGPALFAPKAHGNIRPLGENAYFLALSSLFGVDALPFRIVAFLTQMASLVLLGSIARQMTASRAGGFWAQILWIANSGLAPAMCWTSIYNQILSGFFFLLAFCFCCDPSKRAPREPPSDTGRHSCWALPHSRPTWYIRPLRRFTRCCLRGLMCGRSCRCS